MIFYDKKYGLDKNQEEYEEIQDILDLFSEQMERYKGSSITSTAGYYMNKLNMDHSKSNFARDQVLEQVKEHMDHAEKYGVGLNIFLVSGEDEGKE